MSEYIRSDHKKLSEAVQCIRKSIQCTSCHKIPTEPTAAKCGHPFCKICVNKILATKKSVCGICKNVVTRSGLYELKHVEKIIADLNLLCRAVEKDSNLTVFLDKQPTVKQYRGKRSSLSLPGPPPARNVKNRNSREFDVQTSREESIDSEETVKLKKPTAKVKEKTLSPIKPSTSKINENVREIVFNADKIGEIGTKEKVDNWLISQKFKDQKEDEEPNFEEVIESAGSSCTIISEVLKAFTQAVDESLKNGRAEKGQGDDGPRFQSLTGEALNAKKFASRKIPTPEDETFDELRGSVADFKDNKKPRDSSLLTEESWSDLALLKKETRLKVRKRKRLNISIERPSASRSAEPESEERRNEGTIGSDNDKSAEGKNAATESATKKQKNIFISSMTVLGDDELIDFKKISRRQLKDIIGVGSTPGNLDVSRSSNNSLDEPTPRSNGNKSLNKSGEERSRDRSNEEDRTSRPRSKPDFSVDDSRPHSRMSRKSNGRPTSQIFRLSLNRSTATPQTTPSKLIVEQSTLPSRQAETKIIEPSHENAIRTCADSTRIKLAKHGHSTGSSRGSANVSITKMGKLCKIRNRFKFLRLGSISSDLPKKQSAKKTRNAQTQTSLDLLDSHYDQYVVKRDVQVWSNHGPAGIVDPRKSGTGENALSKLNTSLPKTDSQLRYADVKSSSVQRPVSAQSDKNILRSFAATSRGTSFPSSGVDDYLRAVKNYADDLIVTDSEDQDTPHNGIGNIQQRSISEAKRSRLEKIIPGAARTSFVSKSVSALSDAKTNDDKAGASRAHNSFVNNSLSSANNLKKKTPSRSPRVEKHSASGTCFQSSGRSDAETARRGTPTGKDDSQLSSINAKNKVVRKLKYSQESESKDERESRRQVEKKKTFQRILRFPSTDSETDFLEISLTTKQSSSNSQTVPRPGPSTEVNESPILTSEDMTIVFSSNKDTQESKRKRSPSPHSLDNDAIQAIASNWCADLDKSSEEIAATHDLIFAKAKSFSTFEAPSKKAKVGGSDPLDNDDLPPFSATAKSKEKAKHLDRVAHEDFSISRGNTVDGVVTRRKNSTPAKANLHQNRDFHETTQLSNNSDKENQIKENQNTLLVNGEKSPSKRGQKSDKRDVSSRGNSTTTDKLPLDSSFNRDYMNITQEELLLQEVENNLLGKNSSPSNKVGDENLARKASPARRAVDDVEKKTKGYVVADMPSDDSDSYDEEIVESTPEKNLSCKKEAQSVAENTQRSNISLKSFMSVDITPIAKKLPKSFKSFSESSPLVERSLKLKPSNDLGPSKSRVPRISHHSTPKAAGSGTPTETLGRRSEKRLCFVCSSLTLPQIQNVKSLAARYNAEYTANYKSGVTHVIVETDERNCAGRTLKYLLGVAKKNWIVSYQWVKDSVTKGRLLDEEEYEALDRDTDEPGPRRSRLSKTELFHDFAFVCMKPFADINVDQLQELLTSTGGTVLESLEKLAARSDKHRVILYNGDIHKPAVLENWRQRGAALPVQAEWVLSCISQYELVSLCEYLESVSPEVASDLGFPPQLIVDERNSSGADDSLAQADV